MSISSEITSVQDKLSKKQSVLAKYILDNFYEVALMNAPRIAVEAGVSEPTLTRFIYTLGYKNFSEFQTALRRETQETSPQNPFRQESFGNSHEPVYQRVFKLEYSLMAETLGMIDPNIFEKCVDTLFNSSIIFLVGGPTHGFLADYAANFLGIFCDNVHTVTKADMTFLSLLNSGVEDAAAIVFSYPRYPKETQRITKALSDRKVKIIGMTDSKLSGITPYADLTLITPQKYLTITDPNTSAMAMIHSLIIGVYMKDPKRAKMRLQEYEKAVLDVDMFEFKNYNFALKL